jgi:hypothetical protein
MAVLAILLFATAGAQGEMIRLVPSSAEVVVGSSFNVDVVAENMNLGVFDLQIEFNPVRVGLTSVAPDIFLGDPSLLEALWDISPDLDFVQIGEVSFLSSAELQALQGDSAANSFRLATLTFQANTVGTADFGFGSTELTGPLLEEISATFLGASVLISEPGGPGPGPVPVPEPATWGLLGSAGLVMLGGRTWAKLRLARRRQREK